MNSKNLGRRRKLWLEFINFIKIAVPVAGVIFLVMEYYDNKRDAKIDRALQFTERYYTGQIYSAHSRIFDHLFSEGYMAQANELKHSNENDRDEAEKTDSLASKIAENKDLYVPAYTLADYYFAVAKCGSDGICFEETVCRLFGDKVSHFVMIYIEEINNWESNTDLAGVSDELIGMVRECEKYKHYQEGLWVGILRFLRMRI